MIDVPSTTLAVALSETVVTSPSSLTLVVTGAVFGVSCS